MQDVRLRSGIGRQAVEEFEVDVCEKILEKWEQEIDGILD